MRIRRPITLTMFLVALAAPTSAHASAAQLAIFQADGQLVQAGDATRARTLDELQRLGVDVVKVHAYWHALAPGGDEKPEGFRGWEPASYPDEPFRQIDAVIRGARERGMRVLLSPTGPAPGWATSRRDGDVGVWRPSARE